MPRIKIRLECFLLSWVLEAACVEGRWGGAGIGDTLKVGAVIRCRTGSLKHHIFEQKVYQKKQKNTLKTDELCEHKIKS